MKATPKSRQPGWIRIIEPEPEKPGRYRLRIVPAAKDYAPDSLGARNFTEEQVLTGYFLLPPKDSE